MAEKRNTDDFENNESSAFDSYARNAKSVVRTSESVTESSTKSTTHATKAATSTTETAGKVAKGGSSVVKGAANAASAGLTAVVSGFGKIATAFGVPKQVVAFFTAIIIMFTSLAVVAPNTNDKYAPQTDKLCGNGTPLQNEQMVPKESVSQEELIQRAAKIYRYFHALDFTDEAIAGIIANAMADSAINGQAYEGDDINVNFALTSMHHDDWNEYTKNLFKVYASGTVSEDGFPAHKIDNTFGNETGESTFGSIFSKFTGADLSIDSIYKTNRDLYAAYPSQVEAEHLNSVNGRSLPGFGLFQWSGTRANDMLYFANSLRLARDSDDDMNNDYVYEIPFQIAYLLYENEDDVYHWAKTDYRSDYTTSFVAQFLTYKARGSSSGGGEATADAGIATYTDVTDKVSKEGRTLTTYTSSDAYADFTMADFRNDPNQYRNPENWRVAEASITRTEDYYLYQYNAIIFTLVTDVHKDDPATQDCPEDFNPYGHMDSAYESDVPDHDVVAKDYTLVAVPVLYTLRVQNPESDSAAGNEAVLKATCKQIEKIMWTEKPIDVYEKLKAITGTDIHLKAYVKDVEHGDGDLDNVDNEDYREETDYSTSGLLDTIGKLISGSGDADQKYLKIVFHTTGYWNWICEDFDKVDIDLSSLTETSSALADAYDEYDYAVKKYVALNEQLTLIGNLKSAESALTTAGSNLATRYKEVRTNYNAAKSNYDTKKKEASDWQIAYNNVSSRNSVWWYNAGVINGINGSKTASGYWSRNGVVLSRNSSYESGYSIGDGYKTAADENEDITWEWYGIDGWTLSDLISGRDVSGVHYDGYADRRDDAAAYLSDSSHWPKTATKPSVPSDPGTLQDWLDNDATYQSRKSAYDNAYTAYSSAYNAYINKYNTNSAAGYDTGSTYESLKNKITVTDTAPNYDFKGGDELNRVATLVAAAKLVVNTEYSQYNTAYAAYVIARTAWETNRNKYHNKEDQRDEKLGSGYDRYDTTNPWDQEVWNTTLPRGFDTYWYQYGKTTAVIDSTDSKRCTTFQKKYRADISDPLHPTNGSTNNEGDDYYWDGYDVERYIKYHHRYEVLWKNDDYSASASGYTTTSSKTDGYQGFLSTASNFAFDLMRNSNYAVIQEIAPELLKELQSDFEKYLTDNGMVLADLSKEDAAYWLEQFAKTSERYKSLYDSYYRAYRDVFVYTDEEVDDEVDKLTKQYIENSLMTKLYGSKTVRMEYQVGEDIAYDCAVWFYGNWKNRDYVAESNADFKAHTDTARYWYYVIKSRAWSSYDARTSLDECPMYNDATRKDLVDSYLTGAIMTERTGTGGKLITDTHNIRFGYGSSTDDGVKFQSQDAESEGGLVQDYEIRLLQDATNQIYDMHKRKVCGERDLNLNSAATLAVSMAYPYGEENYTINNVLESYKYKGNDIYPAVRCTETYVSVVNAVIAVENNNSKIKSSEEMTRVANASNLDSMIYAYAVYHASVNINDTNGSGQLLNYSDPGTMVYATYVGSGRSPEMPYSFADQKKYLRYDTSLTMKQAAAAITAYCYDMDHLSDKYGAGTNIPADVIKKFQESERTTSNGKLTSEPIAYRRGSWFLAGEIVAPGDEGDSFNYKMEDSDKRRVPLYGYYKACSMDYNKWVNAIQPGDLIMTESNAYIFVGDEAYDKFKDYMSPIEAHTAVCTAWRSDDDTSISWDKDASAFTQDPLRASGITVLTYNDLIDRGIYDTNSAAPEHVDSVNVYNGIFSTFINRSAALQSNTLKLIYDYHHSKGTDGEKVFVYRCMNYDYELSYAHQVLEVLDFSMLNDGSQPALVKYNGTESYPLYEDTGNESLGYIYEFSVLPDIDINTRSATAEGMKTAYGHVKYMDLSRAVDSFFIGENASLKHRLALDATPVGDKHTKSDDD